jgi:hypothetical protein
VLGGAKAGVPEPPAQLISISRAPRIGTGITNVSPIPNLRAREDWNTTPDQRAYQSRNDAGRRSSRSTAPVAARERQNLQLSFNKASSSSGA